MDIFVKGVYTTKFGELWDRDLRSLGVEAAMGALKDAKMDLRDIDAVYVGNMCASRFAGQDHLGALFATELGIDRPSYHIESACASGGLAIRTAWMDLLAGQSKNILVIGVEKMTDVDMGFTTSGLAGASDEEWEAFYGVTFPSLYAMIAQEHMELFGTTREQLALCAVKNHKHGALNPDAQFRKEITVADVLTASKVADPLGLLDCSPISDGAAAVVLSSQNSSAVKMISSGQAQSSLALHDRQKISTIDSAVKAGNRAFDLAGIKREDIGVMEVHDCFTIAEICAYEDLGFIQKGEGGIFVAEGNANLDGKLPTNTSGGLKACGHPVGATGVKQVAEITKQLRGDAGQRQIKHEAKYGLTHNVGGSGATCVVNIFQKV